MSEKESNVKRLLDLDGTSGKMELDESGYVRFIPSDDELVKMEKYLAEEIERSKTDHEPIFREAAENLKTYKAGKTRHADGDEEILPLPLAAIAADQIISFIRNQIVRARPMVSVDPYFDDEYEVTVPLKMPTPVMDGMGMPMMGPNGMPMTQETVVPIPTPTDSEEIAANFERGLEFKNRERLNLPKLIQEIVSDTVIVGKALIKVCADRKHRTMFAPKVGGAILDFENIEEVRIKSPEVAKMYTIPIFNYLKPVDQDDEPEWEAEKTPITPDTFVSRVKTGAYHLIDKDKAEDYAKVVSDVRKEMERGVRTETQNKPSEGRLMIDLMEVQFDWPVKIKDESGQKIIKKVPLLADWHHGAKKLCCVYRNPYYHQERLITPVYQIQDSHSDTGSCTVGRLKWHQRVATAAIQAEFKNAFHANNFSYWWVPGSPSEDYFENNSTIRPGEAIPGKFNEDWGVTRVGAEHYSLLPLTQWTEGSGQRVSNVSDYEQGNTVPGRTAAATVSQILQAGLQQPLTFLQSLNDSLSRAIRLYLKTCRQYQPFGETIPIRNPKTKQILEIPFRYPVAGDGTDPLDNFRIALTAADEALAKEHEPEQIIMWMKAFQDFANFVAQVGGPLVANLQSTPATTALGGKIISGMDKIFEKYVSIFRVDTEDFSVSQELDALVKEKQAAVQQMQMSGGMGANPNANPGAVQPGPPEANAGGGGPVGLQPGNGPAGGPPPQTGVPTQGVPQ